ncbi:MULTISPECIES: iron-containing alcohol dehydrogenase [unclassified Ensifer]|uniref:iron-containing alcohol dehydrogenase n=1 Tax=unclassified Ensifer TaxID=2633371 RepID=UPI0008134A5C|nr:MULTISPECIES: iron-containing alcohol dehydrogenase [unclassified Ensifer]OCP10050.1 alcohol dehydrogenase [Ensifer sp. LC14]OCP12287.1 alcohol dehydrogenase [Ensifer sp. LC13]OCP13103.1 alcohol dehydrogenase [Ensifer sp. LC11]OCP33848.1 alcohol dehydrogenase [Ensifer sp. LC499]
MTPAQITLHQPRRLVVGAGTIAEVGNWAADATSILVIATPITAGFVDRLKLAGRIAVFDAIPGEPDIATLNAALEVARRQKPDLIVGLGGGSVLDVAKLVAVLWNAQQTLADVAGPNRVAGRSTRLVQVATTAGTGSEAGIRSLITDPEKGNKIAVESPHMIADLAVLDPELTYSVPPAVTAATGVDAMAHCVEAFTNRRAHPMIDGFARMGFRLVGKYLARAVRDGTDTEAREGMMLASYYGGICLGPVNTAAGHAIAYPLGTRLRLPHGLANAIIFPHVLAFNQAVAANKTAEVAQALGLGDNLAARELLDAARHFCRNLGIEMSLAAHGAKTDDLPLYATEAHANRRLMDNNPIDMSVEDVLAVYKAAF